MNQATRFEAGSAASAPAGPARANEQLLRGERAGWLASAPGSPTEEIARMLETEPQNRQPDPNEPEGNRQGSGQEGSQRRGLLRRTRRNVTKPEDSPPFSSGAAESQPGTGQAQAGTQRSAGDSSASGGASAGASPSGGGGKGTTAASGGRGGRTGAAGEGAANSRATRPVPVVPIVPPAEPAQRRDYSSPPPVPAASFQAPVVVFQPPDLTERKPVEQVRTRPEPSAPVATGAGDATDDSDGQGSGSRRRRRGGRGRGKGSAGEGGTADDAGSGQDGAGSAGQGGGAQGGANHQGGRSSGSGPGGSGQGANSQGGNSQGGNGRAGAGAASAAQAGGQAEDSDGEDGDRGDASGDSAGPSSSRRRRRRRQRSGSGGAEGEVSAPDDPTDTVVHVREPRPATDSDDVRAVKGSTRLEAKRQRRRENRDTGRRRPPIISESEFLARREAVERVMLVRQQGDRTQIAVLEDGILVEHYVDKASHQSYVGNVYLGKVQNVLPSMEAAFVDIGKGRNAVLYAGEVNFDATGLEGVAKRIESALKSGQSIMVQVTKDPIGHKGARLTSQISLPGRYLVYVPGASMTGISRKLPDTERTRLKQILKKVAPEEGGIIVRTAAEGATEDELQHDVTRLVAQWQAIERKAKTASSPDLLYGEPDLTIRVVRDIFNEDFTKLVIASDNEWDLVDEYVRYVAPNLSDRLERWSDDNELFAAYRIDEQLAKALDRKVWLPSGGSLVIDTTEAMTVIDVNTGKFTGQGGNLEQTVTRNNLEAAEEIVRQLRLRDIGGIIVIDFIDMVLESNRDLVLRRLIECLARDRTKHQVAEVTSLGLVQMTRKRVGSGLLAAFSVPCEHCSGRGVLISTELTELPHPPGRNGQQTALKPGASGPARSRSARSKAIAQVAAKTIDGHHGQDAAVQAPPGADGPSAEADENAVLAAGDAVETEQGTAVAAGAEPVEGKAKQAPTRAASGRSASTRAKRADASRAEARATATEPAAASPDEAGPEAAEPAEQVAAEPTRTDLAASEPAAVAAAEPAGGETGAPKRRVRRSAYREAGPPDAAKPERAAEEQAVVEPQPVGEAEAAGSGHAEAAEAGHAEAEAGQGEAESGDPSAVAEAEAEAIAAAEGRGV